MSGVMDRTMERVAALQTLDLEVDEDLDEADLKKAFKRAVRKYHPDRTGGDRTRFDAVQDAWELLSEKDSTPSYEGRDGRDPRISFWRDFETLGSPMELGLGRWIIWASKEYPAQFMASPVLILAMVSTPSMPMMALEQGEKILETAEEVLGICDPRWTTCVDWPST